LFFTAVVSAVDKYQDLLRISASSAGNDHRLGGNEAPPAVISMFIGDDLLEIFTAIESGNNYIEKDADEVEFCEGILPHLKKDKTDRNRTSPFAFTGNKFEFRMVGSDMSVAGANMVLNTIVAEQFKIIADKIESSSDVNETIDYLIVKAIRKHGRIIFNGDGYNDAWVAEAGTRGLSNYRTTADCVPHLLDRKNVEMLTRQKVFSLSEIESRCEVMLETYCKTICIEARTMRSMAMKRIAPAIEKYTAELASNAASKRRLIPDLECRFEDRMIRFLSQQTDRIYDDVDALVSALDSLSNEDYAKDAGLIRDCVLPAMDQLRADSDAAEAQTSKAYWPLPNYGLLLFGEK
jgi:glutamine synthetase